MTMKKFISNIKTLAALLMAVAALAACSNEDVSVNEQLVVNPTETAPKTYTMTIQATKSSGDDAATTRGLYFNGTALNVKWYEGEVVEVYQGVEKKGTLTAAASSNGTTTLTGEVSTLSEYSDIAFYLHSVNRDYRNQKGVLLKPETGEDNSIETNYDFAQCSVAYNDITIDGTTISIPGGIALQSYQSIVKFTLTDKDGNALNATKLTIEETHSCILRYYNITQSGGFLDDYDNLVITPTPATNVVYAAINVDNEDNGERAFFLTAEANGKTYVYGPQKATFEHGKYYEVTVKMQEEDSKAIYIWRESDDITAQTGDVLVGNMKHYNQISIAAGATVTLRNVTIVGDNDEDDDHAGITCEGDATIILEGTNSVTGFYEDYPGIYVPVGKKLIIQGSGKLTASSNGYGAGIGGGRDLKCGNIVIESGTIVANGGQWCAGIGSGYSSNSETLTATCGDITIKGGDITAVSYCDGAAIGSGLYGSCGKITITGGTVRAILDSDENGGAGIGSGRKGHCGNILISGGTIIATGGDDCPGIGSSCVGSCGTITITNANNQTSVTATKGNGGFYCIGNGDEVSTCGTITIGDTEYYNGSTWASTELENTLKATTFTWPSAQ